jgi:hypothetical protein
MLEFALKTFELEPKLNAFSVLIDCIAYKKYVQSERE